LFEEDAPLKAHEGFWADVQSQFIKLLFPKVTLLSPDATKAAEAFEHAVKFSNDPATKPLAQGEENWKTAIYFRVAFSGSETGCRSETEWFQNVNAKYSCHHLHDQTNIISREQWCKIVSHVWQEAQIDKLWRSLSTANATGDTKTAAGSIPLAAFLNSSGFGSDYFADHVWRILQLFGLSGDASEIDNELGCNDGEKLKSLVSKVLAKQTHDNSKLKEQLMEYHNGKLTRVQFHDLLCFLQTIVCPRMRVTNKHTVEDSVRCQRLQVLQRPGIKLPEGDMLILESESKVTVEMTLAKDLKAGNADEEILLMKRLVKDYNSFPSNVDWHKARQQDAISVTGMDGCLRITTRPDKDDPITLRRHNALVPAMRGQTISFELPAKKATAAESEWKICAMDDGVSVEVAAEGEGRFVQGEQIYILNKAKNVLLGKGQARYFSGSCFIIVQQINSKFSPLREGQPVHVCNQKAQNNFSCKHTGNISTEPNGEYPQKAVIVPGIGTKKIPVALTLSLDVVGLTSQQFVHMRQIHRVVLFLIFLGLVGATIPLLWWRYRLEAQVQLAPFSPIIFEIQNCDVRFGAAESLHASVQMGQHEGSHWSATSTSIQAFRPSSSHIRCLLRVGVPSNGLAPLPPMAFKVRRKARCAFHPEYINIENSSGTVLWNQSRWNHTDTSAVPQACSSTEYESDAVTIKGSELLDFGGNSLKILASDTHVDIQLKHVRADLVTVLVGAGQIELEDMTISNRSVVSTGQGDVLITTSMPNVTLAYDTNMSHQCVAAEQVREDSVGLNASQVVLRAGTDTDTEEPTGADTTGSRHITVDLNDGALYFTLFAAASNSSASASTANSTSKAPLQVLQREHAASFVTFFDVQSLIRDWIAEAPTLDHVAYIEVLGPGQREAGRWMFTTNKVYRFINPWVLSVLSGGLLTPRRKFVSARMFPAECPYMRGWQADDNMVLAAVTMSLSNTLKLKATEALVLLQEDELKKFVFSKEGRKIGIKMTDSRALVAAIVSSFCLSGFAAWLLGFVAYWFVLWGASNFHKSSRSRKVYRLLGANKVDTSKDKELMVENRRTAINDGKQSGDEDLFPGPLELIIFAIEESVQNVRLKAGNLLTALAHEPKQGLAIQPKKFRDKRATDLDLPQPRNLTRLDIVEAKRAKYSLINIPHPLQIHWMLTSKLMAQFKNSLRLFVEHASSNPTPETESEFYTSDEPMKLDQFASAYHSFCFHNSMKIESIVANAQFLEAEGIELFQQRSEELIGLQLLPVKPGVMQTSNDGNYLSAFIEYRCHLSGLETDRTFLGDFIDVFNEFVNSARHRHMEEIGRIWKKRDQTPLYW
jgi:hypothetical protein